MSAAKPPTVKTSLVLSVFSSVLYLANVFSISNWLFYGVSLLAVHLSKQYSDQDFSEKAKTALIVYVIFGFTFYSVFLNNVCSWRIQNI